MFVLIVLDCWLVTPVDVEYPPVASLVMLVLVIDDDGEADSSPVVVLNEEDPDTLEVLPGAVVEACPALLLDGEGTPT